MNFDISKSIDSIRDGIKEVTDYGHDKIHGFHKNYVSKVLPDFGKYGDVAKFSAEIVPGVSEYNAINEGDWKSFAIAAGIDVGSFAAGIFTAGTGFAAVKGGTSAAKAGIKAATKEVAEASVKKAVKETAETGIKKASRETIDAETERIIKEAAEAEGEKVVKDWTENVEKKVLKVGDKIDKKLFTKNIDNVEKITNREILPQQKELIDKALKDNEFRKLNSEDIRYARRDFNNIKDRLIKEWEKNTNQEWPRYTEDLLGDAGNPIRRAGDRYDVHHLIELKNSGANEWWNLHPASVTEHKEIHAINK